MTDHFAVFSDSLDEILSAPAVAAKLPPANYSAPSFTEPCAKCRGSGRFVGFSGRSVGACFTCQGTGKRTFKTSYATRTASRDRVQAKAANAVDTFNAEHPAIAAWIASNQDFGFAVAMGEAVAKWGTLTGGQIAACERCIAAKANAVAARVERTTNAPSIAVDQIEAAFASAKAKGLKRLRLNLGAFEFKPAGSHTANAGAIYVTESGDYIGKVSGGRFVATASCGAERAAQVVATAADPKAAAIAHGKFTGSCSCCRRPLTNKKSIELGIGPICAEKYGW